MIGNGRFIHRRLQRIGKLISGGLMLTGLIFSSTLPAIANDCPAGTACLSDLDQLLAAEDALVDHGPGNSSHSGISISVDGDP